MPESWESTNDQRAKLEEIAGFNTKEPKPVERTAPKERPLNNPRLSPEARNRELTLSEYNGMFRDPNDDRYAIHKKLAKDVESELKLLRDMPGKIRKTGIQLFIEELHKRIQNSDDAKDTDWIIYIKHIMDTYYLPLFEAHIDSIYGNDMDYRADHERIKTEYEIESKKVKIALKYYGAHAGLFFEFYNILHHTLDDWLSFDMNPDHNQNLIVYGSRPEVSLSPLLYHYELLIETDTPCITIKQLIKKYQERARRINPVVTIYISEERIISRNKHIDFYQEPSGKKKCFDLLCRLLSDYIRKKISTSGGKTIRRRVRHRQTIKKRAIR